MTCSSVPTSRSEQTLLEASRKAGMIEEDECSVGPTAKQVKEAQKLDLKEGLADLAKLGAPEALSHVAEHVLDKAVSGVGAIFIAHHLLEAFNDAHLEGEAQNQAYRRDAVNLAFVWAGAQALPPEYVAFKSEELKSAGGEHGPASKILGPLQGDKWQRVVKDTNEAISQARQVGERLGIRSMTSLKAALAKNPQLQRAYDSSLVIRHAFDSLVFQGERRESPKSP